MKTLKYLSASDVSRRLADKIGIPQEQVRALLQAQAELAYECAREGIEIPGLGVLVATDRAERQGVSSVGPNAGKKITLPAKTVLRFHVAEAARATAAGERPAPPNVFELELFPNAELEAH